MRGWESLKNSCLRLGSQPELLFCGTLSLRPANTITAGKPCRSDGTFSGCEHRGDRCPFISTLRVTSSFGPGSRVLNVNDWKNSS